MKTFLFLIVLIGVHTTAVCQDSNFSRATPPREFRAMLWLGELPSPALIREAYWVPKYVPEMPGIIKLAMDLALRAEEPLRRHYMSDLLASIDHRFHDPFAVGDQDRAAEFNTYFEIAHSRVQKLGDPVLKEQFAGIAFGSPFADTLESEFSNYLFSHRQWPKIYDAILARIMFKFDLATHDLKHYPEAYRDRIIKRGARTLEMIAKMADTPDSARELERWLSQTQNETVRAMARVSQTVRADIQNKCRFFFGPMGDL